VQRTAAELKYEESGGLSPVALRQERVARKMNAHVAAARVQAAQARVTRGRGAGGTRDGA